MNVIIKSNQAEVECRGLLTKAFMNDLTVTATSVPGSGWILQDQEKLKTSIRISFKLRSVLLKRRVTSDYSYEPPLQSSQSRLWEKMTAASKMLLLSRKELEALLTKVDKRVQ